MRRFFVRLFAVIGFVTFVGVLGVAGLIVMLVRSGGTTSLPDSIVLTADLTGGLSDVSDPDTMSRLLFGEQRTLRDFVDAVERAAYDPRVKSLYVQLGDDSLGHESL